MPSIPFGSDSEYAPLRSVLMRRPGREIDAIMNPQAVLFQDFIRPGIARRQHDRMVEQLAAEGVSIKYIDLTGERHPNLYFCRDLVLITSSGAVVCRPGSISRSGEEVDASETLVSSGIPIAFRVFSPGTLEGGDICVASPDLVLIGNSKRTNLEGARQLASFLTIEGFRNVEIVSVSPHTLHLDMTFAVLDRDLAAICEERTPAALRALLAKHSFRTVNLPNNEVTAGMALNLLCLGPRRVMLPSGNRISRSRLERAGVSCVEADVSELMKGGGALHCMTAVLKRDLIAKPHAQEPICPTTHILKQPMRNIPTSLTTLRNCAGNIRTCGTSCWTF
ncbi:MAG: arginine deiminase family protein [Nitrospirota bacterium]